MSGMNDNINSASAQTGQSEVSPDVQLKAGYRTYENYLYRVQIIYNRTKDDFFTLRADDARLLEAAERWRIAAVSLMRWAGSFYKKSDATAETRALALTIMDVVTKDSATRCDNVSQYYDILAEKKPDNIQALLNAEKADLKHLDVLSRMIETEEKYIRKETEATGHESRPVLYSE